MKPSFLQQAKKTNKLQWSRTEQWRHFSFSIDLFLLHPKLLRALDDRNITLLFVSYLLLKAKSSQRNFKWALQPFMVLKTPVRKWKACISWLQATSTSTLDLHFLFFFLLFWSVAFVTAGCFAFICHSQRRQTLWMKLYLIKAVGTCEQQRGV